MIMQHKYISLICLLALSATAFAQQDTAVVDRTVYVTRDFQPTVESAGKISVKPQIFEPEIRPRDPQYSTYSSPLQLDYTMNKLDFSVLNFRQPKPYRGYLEAGAGHVNSLFLFNYRITDADMQTGKKRVRNDLFLDLHAKHQGQWGRKALSESCLGLDFSKTFHKAELYAGAEGEHEFFTRYGHYYDPLQNALSIERYKEIDPLFRQQVWQVNTKLGVRSIEDADTKFAIQAGYEAFIVPELATEHIIHTAGMFDWKRNYYHVGAVLDMENRLYSKTDTSMLIPSNHRIHLEPYFSYEVGKWHVHAGVNIDFSVNKGKIPGVSPNLDFEYAITQNWLAAYANVTGHYNANGARGEYRENRYLQASLLFTDTCSGEYVPVDLEVGLKVRPYATLSINLHAGYMAQIDKHTNVFFETGGKGVDPLNVGTFRHMVQDASVWKIGADIHYHFRDIVNVNLSGNYYSAKAVSSLPIAGGTLDNTYFDAPSWTVRARIDGKINQKWSLYTDNHFAGGMKACVYAPVTRTPGMEPQPDYRVESLRPMIDLNLGLKYEINKWVSVYAELNNYLAWTDKLSYSTYYGYEAQRANCMFGLSWIF